MKTLLFLSMILSSSMNIVFAADTEGQVCYACEISKNDKLEKVQAEAKLIEWKQLADQIKEKYMIKFLVPTEAIETNILFLKKFAAEAEKTNLQKPVRKKKSNSLDGTDAFMHTKLSVSSKNKTIKVTDTWSGKHQDPITDTVYMKSSDDTNKGVQEYLKFIKYTASYSYNEPPQAIEAKIIPTVLPDKVTAKKQKKQKK